MKKPVLVLAITAIATFVMGWVAHRVYRNSQQVTQELVSPELPKKPTESKTVGSDSTPTFKDSSIYHHTNFIPPKPDSMQLTQKDSSLERTELEKEVVLKFIPVSKFSDFSVKERFKGGLSKKLDFSTCSSGLLYKKETKLAVEKGAVFAGRFSFTIISCDSNCYSSTIVDLKNGQVYAGPHATIGYKYNVNSRLVYVNPPKADSTYDDCFDCTPELYLWTGKLFKKIQ